MQQLRKTNPKFINSLMLINMSVNQLWTINDSFSIVNFDIEENNGFDDKRYTQLTNTAMYNGDITVECAKAINQAMLSILCESQMINRWCRQETLAAEICKEALAFIDKQGVDVEAINMFGQQIMDCRKKQTEILADSQKPNFKIPTNSPYYVVELHKAGFQNGFRAGWAEIVEEILASNPTPIGSKAIDEIFEMFSNELENFVITATKARAYTYKLMNQLALLSKA